MFARLLIIFYNWWFMGTWFCNQWYSPMVFVKWDKENKTYNNIKISETI
jgi:hypothetical protein